MSAIERRLVELVEDVIGLTSLDEFRPGLLDALLRAIPSQHASLNDLGPSPDDVTVVSIPVASPGLLQAFARLNHENPIALHHIHTRDGRAYRFSDLITRRELRRLELYRQVYAPLGIKYQIAFTLPTTPNRLLGVALSRTDRDYTNTERELINRARPLLIQTFRNAIDHDLLRTTLADLHNGTAIAGALAKAGLTDRESQIIAALAHGRSKRDIAAHLSISQRTVAKHLERSFQKLGVHTQSAAATEAWRLAEAIPTSSG